MLLFYRYSRRIFVLLALILAVEYAIVHRISLDALTRSDIGLSQWRQLLTDCNCSDCPVRHLTLIHDGLYQRAYSIHLLHRVLAISSEDGDPYEAFEDDELGDESTEEEESRDDNIATKLVPSLSDELGVPYAYAPGDMLSNPVPVTAALQVAGSRPVSPAGSEPVTVPALSMLPASDPTPPTQHLNPQAEAQHHDHQQQQHYLQQQQQQHLHNQQQRLAAPGAAAAGADSTASGSPRLLQAVVWQSSKVLSVFPWQLRAHFFLSLASTRMYLLMGLWPRAAAVAAAAPRRLRQQQPLGHHFPHHHHPAGQQQQQQQRQQQKQQPASGQVDGHDPSAGPVGVGSGGVPSLHSQQQQQQGGHSRGRTHGQHESASAPPSPPYGYAVGGATAAGGGSGFSHPHVQAQAAAHAYAHVYDGMGSLYGFSRTVTDESQSLAAALSALGRGVPVFLPPEMLVEHGVQEDLMASCVFKPAVKNVPGRAVTAGGGDGGIGGAGRSPLPRWRTWPSLLSRWMAHLAGRIAHHGGRTAARLRAAGMPVRGAQLHQQHQQHSPADGDNDDIGGDGANSDPWVGSRRAVEQQQAQQQQQGVRATAAAAAAAVSRWLSSRAGGPRAWAAGSSQQHQVQQHQQPPQHAYVECRLYRTDRVRNVSYTCPAVLTVLPSPPRGSGRTWAHLHQALHYLPHLQQQHQQQQYQSDPGSASGSVGANDAATAVAAAAACPAAGNACPASTPAAGSHQPQPQHYSHQPPEQQQPQAQGARSRQKPRLLRRLWSDLRYMAYGAVMPYKWAPILAGILSPHMFLLACLPAVQSLGLMGPFSLRLWSYHAACIVLTGADHMLLLRLFSELWVRARPRGQGPAGRQWRRWLALSKWLLWDGFLASGWVFRAVVMGILTTKQLELWNHLYGALFKPHPLLSFCLVLPASWLAACAACSAAWRLTASYQPTSVPLLLFQEGFLSGLSSPLYSLVYISFAVLGLGGGGVGGGAGGVLGLAAAGSRLPLWLLDAVAVSPMLTVVALDVLWNMDAAARATPLLMLIVNALRVHQAQDDAAAGRALGRRGRGVRGPGGAAAAAAAVGGGVAGDQDWVPPRAVAVRDGAAALKQHTSLWMLLDSARWWAHHVRDVMEEERVQQQQQQNHNQQQQQQDHHLDVAVAAAAAAGLGPAAQEAGGGGGGGGGGAPIRERAVFMVARLTLAARNAGMVELPPRVLAGMLAAILMPLQDDAWPPRQEDNARALDLLLDATAAAPQPVPRAGRGVAAAAGGFGGGGVRAGGGVEEEEEDFNVDGVDEILGNGLDRFAGGGDGGGQGERMVRTSEGGTLRPLSALEDELRAGLARVAALRSQLAAVGRGVADLLLLGRWPPPLVLPAEALAWCDSVPHGFLCPITHSLMTQPALLVSPQLSEASPTYELSAIRQWLRSNRTDPTTGRYLHTYHFIHNDNLRKAIEDWVADRLAREQEQQQQQQQEQEQHRYGQQLQQPQPQLCGGHLSPTGRPRQGAGAAASHLQSPARKRLLQPSAVVDAVEASRVAAGLSDCVADRYQPVAGPGPGQRSVCVGTSEMGLRMLSPERFRSGCAALDSRSRARGRSRSRSRALRPAGSDVAGGGNGGGGGGGGSGGVGNGIGVSTAAAVVARQALQRATSRQRGLQRSQAQ